MQLHFLNAVDGNSCCDAIPSQHSCNEYIEETARGDEIAEASSYAGRKDLLEQSISHVEASDRAEMSGLHCSLQQRRDVTLICPYHRHDGQPLVIDGFDAADFGAAPNCNNCSHCRKHCHFVDHPGYHTWFDGEPPENG